MTNVSNVHFDSILHLLFSECELPIHASVIDKAISNDNLSHEHLRILPMLYKKLTPSFFSEKSWTKCKGLYKHTFYRNLLQTERAHKFQLTLSQHLDSPIIALKGLSAFASICDDLGERPMSDIDFLIPKFPLLTNDLSKILEEASPHLVKKKDILREILFIDREGFEYDIHRFLHNYASTNTFTNLLIQNTEKINIKKYTFSVLCPELQFIHVLYHGMLSPAIANSQRWIIDAIFLINKNHLNYQLINESFQLLEAPSVIKNGVSFLRKISHEINFDRTMLDRLSLDSYKKNYFIEKITTMIQRPKKSPLDFHWYLITINYWLITPYRWRKHIPIKHYYKTIINNYDNKSPWQKTVLKIITMRLFSQAKRLLKASRLALSKCIRSCF